MKLSISDVMEADRGVLAPCGIACLGCELHLDESLAPAKSVLQIWDGFNYEDICGIFRIDAEEMAVTLKTLRKYIENRERSGPCRGCFHGEGMTPRICSISQCVRSRGYWSCAECRDFDATAESPCPHSDDSDLPLGSRDRAFALISKRYNGTNLDNLKKCREIGYAQFIEAMRSQVKKGWRTWNVISRERIVSKRS